jgi:hypothetical protein
MADKNVREFFNSLTVKDFPASEDVALLLDSESSLEGFPLLKRVPFNNILSLEKTNTIIVNENAGMNIGGKLYSTLTDAIDYIVSEGCSPTTPWSIMVEGDYNPDAEEAISLPRGCTIKGTITNVIGANVTIDPPYISVLSENPTAVLLTTGFATITFRGKLSISFKGLDPASGDTYPYMTGMSLTLVTFSPYEISGTGVTTMLFNSIYCSILQGDYSGFVFNRHMFNNIASIDGDIIFDGFQLFNSQILGSDNVSSTYGITFLNTGTSGIDYFASNCYFQIFKPASGQTKIIDGKGQFWNCSMELAWDGIKASRLYFRNCLIDGTKKIGGVEDDNTLQVNSNGTLSILGGYLNVGDDGKIEMLADMDETPFLEIKGVNTDSGMGYNIDVYKTGDGTVRMTLTDISVPFLNIDASITVSRYGCLWDDAPDTDENNFYSAKKIHELIV